MPGPVGAQGFSPGPGVSYRGMQQAPLQRTAPTYSLPTRSTVIASPSRQLPTIQAPGAVGVSARGTTSSGLTVTQPSVLVPGSTSTGSGGPATSVITGTRPLPSVSRPSGTILGTQRPVGTSSGVTSIVPQLPQRGIQAPQGFPGVTNQTQPMSPYAQNQFAQNPYALRSTTATGTGCTTVDNGIFGFFENTIGAVVRSFFGMSATTCTTTAATTTTGTTTTTATDPTMYGMRSMYGSQLPMVRR